MKKKTTQETLEELLAEVSFDELKAFVLEQALNDSYFRRLLKASFIRKKDKVSKTFYRKEIKAIFRAAKGYTGFVNRPAMRAASQQILPFLNLAHESLESKEFSSSFLISTVVVEEMTKAFGFADDSNGDVGDLIHFALAILKDLSQAELSTSTRKAFFKYCLTTFKKASFEGWDWHFNLLEFAADLLETKKEAQDLMNLLDEKRYKGYNLRVIQVIKHQLIQKTEGAAAALVYLEQNINNPDLRKVVLQQAFDQEAYSKVIALANDGIAYDQKDAPGLASEWEKWLLKVAQKQKDRPTIIKYARRFFIHDFRKEQDYYQLLKQTVDPKDWEGFLEALILEITSIGDWYKVDLLAGIYIEEKWWERLFKLVQSQVSFNMLEHYEGYLKQGYADDLIDLYAQEILNYLDENAGRNYYKNACRYIRKIQKMGAKDKVEALIETLQNKYAKRPALLDELSKIKR